MDAVSGAEGQWIADALERYIGKKGYFGAVAVVIPDQFEAYARIFHPVDEMNAQGPGLRWADLARSKTLCSIRRLSSISWPGPNFMAAR